MIKRKGRWGWPAFDEGRFGGWIWPEDGSIDDLELFVEVVAVRLADREFLFVGSQVELVAFDLPDGAEIDDV